MVNTQYNKAVYTALAGSGITMIALGIKQFAHVDLDPALVAAATAFTTSLVTLLVPNAVAQ